ncbi:uroporphyrinogen-III synthase [Thalassotalea profundi]|uniref:Uroporphyrinogen-III synthase n=1 Tax=Thalassotalea profundi TaxID=2036687 RepID=A0ABQ3IMA7_9GAMM|nr:uroporphyrinogen-III synthase [Thalassotalea profundi]GHE88555.1 uroporphyrinogen III methyltransferase [Thalassotalea profundi]
MNQKINTILVPRPKAQGEKLAQQLILAGFKPLCHPIMTYNSNANEAIIRHHLIEHKPTILVFVSIAAVEFAQQHFSINQWQSLSDIEAIIAVGSSTQEALKRYNIESLCPNSFDSEGMLALPILEQPSLSHCRVTIVRGEDGREYLAQNLEKKGAKVNFLSVYEKVWLEFAADQAQQWRQSQINCIVVTSNAFLNHLVQIIDISDDYWKNHCFWFVISERVAVCATALGLRNVINTHGATNQAIITTLLNTELTYD